ncbi:MAG: FAD:protein FMN transferase [Anaerolineales bacterium]
MIRVPFRAMGCQMLVAMDAETPAAAERAAQAPAWFETWEDGLSRFRPESELNRLNRRAGQPTQVSPVLWQALQAALRAARDSDGLVTPTLLDALEAAGYDRSFEHLIDRTLPPHNRVTPEPDGAGRQIQMQSRTHMVTLPSGTRVELGGIAKGWAAEQAARRLGKMAPALVDAGGDIAVSGPRADGQAWPVGITDPRDPDSTLSLLRIPSGGVATSGRDYRRWQQNGASQHHILDPRTGRPAKTDVLSATVVAPDVCTAEMAAKVVLILGSQAGLAWLEARPALAGLAVLEDGPVLCSERMQAFFWN